MFVPRTVKPKQIKDKTKFKYGFISQIYDKNINSSFDSSIGVTRAKQPLITFPQKIKSNASFSIQKQQARSEKRISQLMKDGPKTDQKPDKSKNKFKLPQIRRSLKEVNPEDSPQLKMLPQLYYQSKLFRSLKMRENTYMMNLARQHFLQNVQAIKIGRNLKLNPPKEIKLSKRNPKFKTIFLDLDETLIHCDESSINYTIKLNFPMDNGGTIAAGIRVRPFCHEFIKQLSSFAEVIIFTASASSYADVVLDYLDPTKKYFSHRLYRQHCTLEKGYYTKDLRIVNRRPEDIAIVDNSAFSYMTQPQFGIPILPYYHFAKDKQLTVLLEFLRRLVEQADIRTKIQQIFCWDSFKRGEADPRKVFLDRFESEYDSTI